MKALTVTATLLVLIAAFAIVLMVLIPDEKEMCARTGGDWITIGVRANQELVYDCIGEQ